MDSEINETLLWPFHPPSLRASKTTTHSRSSEATASTTARDTSSAGPHHSPTLDGHARDVLEKEN